MVLYSIIPNEVVFANQSEEISGLKYEEVEYLGEWVQVLPVEDKYVVNRIISTYPGAYLNPKLVPGSVIGRQESGSFAFNRKI